MSCTTCDTCRRATPIPSCNEELVIGTLAHIGSEYENFDVWVIIQNNSTGKTKMVEITTDSDSRVVMTDPTFNKGQSYTIWIVAKDGYSLDDKLNLIVYDEAYSPTEEILCVDFNVIDIPYTGYGTGWFTTLKLEQ